MKQYGINPITGQSESTTTSSSSSLSDMKSEEKHEDTPMTSITTTDVSMTSSPTSTTPLVSQSILQYHALFQDTIVVNNEGVRIIGAQRFAKVQYIVRVMDGKEEGDDSTTTVTSSDTEMTSMEVLKSTITPTNPLHVPRYPIRLVTATGEDQRKHASNIKLNSVVRLKNFRQVHSY